MACRLDEWDPKRARGGRPWRRIVAHIRNSGSDICIICGKWIDKSLRWPDPQSFSVDHIVALANGGHPTDLNNLGPAHLRCNESKGSRDLNVDRANRQSADW